MIYMYIPSEKGTYDIGENSASCADVARINKMVSTLKDVNGKDTAADCQGTDMYLQHTVYVLCM